MANFNRYETGASMVTAPVMEMMGVKTKVAVSRHFGVSSNAVGEWDRKGKLPPLQAIRLHRDFGVPMDRLYPLVEGL